RTQHEARQPASSPALVDRAREDADDTGPRGAVPAFRAGQAPAARGRFGPARDPTEMRAGARLGERERAELPARREQRPEFVPQRRRCVPEDWPQSIRVVQKDERRKRKINGAELLVHAQRVPVAETEAAER